MNMTYLKNEQLGQQFVCWQIGKLVFGGGKILIIFQTHFFK